ncbi:hypothetical protein [Pseudobutyrivibrio sp. MD2005]|uniref:hypothetical protein n=1 Tax=Pseudobutyrivibrio sp. MD2005 TaxID=1410616 RepID=UPI0004891AD6|nr:hypothetical protein [Pseudobutyrivibrio sp. MD2005]
MYLDYRNKTYKLVRDGDEWEIISNDVRSIMDGFRKDGNIYYKQINNQKLLNTRYGPFQIIIYGLMIIMRELSLINHLGIFMSIYGMK